jgi:Ran GTPase-activating protein (RanGAP) involved in mRNA processing and transport
VGAALSANAVLTTLMLQGNGIGDAGAVPIAKCLGSGSALSSLNLQQNRLGAEFEAALGKALVVNSRIRYLDLAFNAICGVDISRGLGQNTSLVELVLAGNHLG